MSQGAFFNHTVPEGLVAVLRGFRYEIAPLFAGIPIEEITGRLTVGGPARFSGGLLSGGADVPGFERFQLGQYQADFQPCYVIAGPGMTISLLLFFSGTYAGFTQNTINVEFYGNTLLATGRPVNYEPGFSEPLPVYDRSDYQVQREKELVTSNVVAKGQVTTGPTFPLPTTPMPVIAPKPVVREQYTAPRPTGTLVATRGLWSRPGTRRRR